jgi:hypothetical protein
VLENSEEILSYMYYPTHCHSLCDNIIGIHYILGNIIRLGTSGSERLPGESKSVLPFVNGLHGESESVLPFVNGCMANQNLIFEL